MKLSLVGLAQETRSYEGDLLRHDELLSIMGLLPMPSPGMLTHYTSEFEPYTAVQATIARNSFILIEEAVEPKIESDTSEHRVHALGWQAAVQQARAALEELDSLSREALYNRVRWTGLRKELASMPVSDPARSGLEKELNDVADTWLNFAKRRTEASRKLNEARGVPGVVVARWQVHESGGVFLSAGGMMGGGFSSSSQMHGFLVLGGVRALSLYLSNDLFNSVRSLMQDPQGGAFYYHIVDKMRLTTFCLQAKYVAYTQSMSYRDHVQFAATLSGKDLAQIEQLLTDADRIELSAYYSAEHTADAGAAMPGIKWSTVTMDDEIFLPKGMNVLNQFAADPATAFPAELQGWNTILVQMAGLGPKAIFFKEKILGPPPK